MSAGRAIGLVALVISALLGVTAEGLAAERRVALVIGNAAYRNAPALTNPARDAQSIADMLKSAGFETVELRQNLDSLDLKRAIRSFLLSARDSDVAVVFFAGHGIEVNGSNYILPVDAKLKTDFDAEDEGVPLDRIIRAVEPSKRLRLIILDACRDNPFINLMQRTVGLRAITAGLGKVEPESSDTLVAYAARAGSFAEDGNSEHSPFTTALLKHLPTPGLDIRVAFGRVRDDVMRTTNGRQEPFVYGSLGGSTISIVPEKAPEGKAPSADSYAETRRDYEFAERVGTKDGWTYFLQAHPTGFFAELARSQLSKFTDKPTTVARVDVSKPETRTPTLTPPIALPAPAEAQATAPPKQAALERAPPLPAVAVDPCVSDRETLARLRSSQEASEILIFAKALRCEALRPQLTRLIESTAALESQPGKSAAAKPPATPAQLPAASAPTPAVIASEARPDCAKEAQTLARLRLEPDFKAVDRFSRELTCKELKPQVMRLRESLAED